MNSVGEFARLRDGRRLRSQGKLAGGVEGFKTDDGLLVMVTKMGANPIATYGHHVSISRLNNPPTSDDVDAIRELFFGDTAVMQVGPSPLHVVHLIEKVSS